MYGSIPVATHLKFLNMVLSPSDNIPVESSVPDENHWTFPRRVTAFCYPDPLIPDKERQITISVGYKMKR
ncbi:hypothetical protein MXB_435 [Myxobolus squamalis]|nr:hypothetical protein MXB_435 [Myxobolus squamalis]